MSNASIQVAQTNGPLEGATQETMKIRNNSIWHPLNRYGNYFLILWTFTTIAVILAQVTGAIQ